MRVNWFLIIPFLILLVFSFLSSYLIILEPIRDNTLIFFQLMSGVSDVLVLVIAYLLFDRFGTRSEFEKEKIKLLEELLADLKKTNIIIRYEKNKLIYLDLNNIKNNIKNLKKEGKIDMFILVDMGYVLAIHDQLIRYVRHDKMPKNIKNYIEKLIPVKSSSFGEDFSKYLVCNTLLDVDQRNRLNTALQNINLSSPSLFNNIEDYKAKTFLGNWKKLIKELKKELGNNYNF